MYHWIDKTATKEVRRFFTEAVCIPDGFYDKHEAIFCRLIFNTRRLGSNVEDWTDMLEAMDGVLRNFPNMQNKKLFFQNAAIKALWFGEFEGQTERYFESKVMMDAITAIAQGVAIAFSAGSKRKRDTNSDSE